MAFVACACVLDDFSLERVDAERCVAELSSPILLCFPPLIFLRIRRQRPHLSTCSISFSFCFFFFFLLLKKMDVSVFLKEFKKARKESGDSVPFGGEGARVPQV
ncbi:hypothetical protein TcCL_NonESM12548 [Trypanosoma cruzi]|nr:hypothetical protein TcCL_NonESM12548 [Trypanosoma cruzi]